MSTIFFTDGVLAKSISSSEGVLEEYVVFSETRSILKSLQRHGARMGMIVYTRGQSQELLEQSLSKSGLLGFFDPKLVIYSDGFSKQILKEAATEARTEPGRILFVAEHCIERVRALEVGFDAAIPHPSLVSELMNEGKVAYIRVSRINGENGIHLLSCFVEMPIVPFYLSPDRDGSVYIITSIRIAEELRSKGIDVKIFGDEHDPQKTDPHLAHDDRKTPKGTSPMKGAIDSLDREGKARFIVTIVDKALLLALPPEVSIEETHFPNAKHGHNRRLVANTSLIVSLLENSAKKPMNEIVAAQLTLTGHEIDVLRRVITTDTIKGFHAPYVGDVPLDGFGFHVRSRHVSHPHNAAVTTALCRRLEQIGGKIMALPKRRDFYLSDKVLSNIEAELPGSEPKSVIIIGAHFDSTARLDGVNDPAPGADDDASGIAAVLAAAQAAVELRASGQLKRSLRFVLFNAEEDQIYGSQQYALSEFQNGVEISGVFQMDMIGYPDDSPQREFEVHTGFPINNIVEIKSAELARILSAVTSQVSRLRDPQLYPAEPGGSDPCYDRSDHTSFHGCGYAACLVSEDANVGPMPKSPSPRPNPNYHKTTDKKVNYSYVAEIARVVAAAAIVAAKS